MKKEQKFVTESSFCVNFDKVLAFGIDKKNPTSINFKFENGREWNLAYYSEETCIQAFDSFCDQLIDSDEADADENEEDE